jgi:hypothetical protein
MRPALRGFATHALRLAPLVGLWLLFFVTTLRGLDFGDHWDEVGWQIQPVREMVASGLFMPRAAMYPAFARWLVLIPAELSGLRAFLEVGLAPRQIQAAMLSTFEAPRFLLEVRAIFGFVSSLAIVWTYLAALVLGLKRWQAFVAASALGLSWEYAYHCRYVATDCIDVQFSALTLLFVCCFVRYRRAKWLYAAAVAAGLGVGTKFSAGPLLFPVLLAGAWALPLWKVRAQLERGLAVLATAFVAFAISTPAVLFDPFTFVEQLRFISTYYSRGHYGYGVEAGFEHWYKVLEYFAFSYFSPYIALSCASFALVLVGAVVWWRAERPVGALLIGFPLVFLAAVCNRFAVMIVRNYLMIAPWCGILLAGALGAAVERFGRRAWVRRGVFGLLGVVGLANAAFLVKAAESIRKRSLDRDLEQALAAVRKRTSERFLLSPQITAFAKSHGLALGPNVTDDDAAHVVFIARSEGPRQLDWPANDPFAVEEVFGPLEVNFRWYPTWSGDDRVLMMTRLRAQKLGVPFLSR